MFDFFRDIILEAVGMDSRAVAYERKNGSNMWICRCDCGNKISVDAGNLLTGAITSCGCIYDELLSPGQRFGKLTVVRPVEDGGINAWLVKCDCGNTTFATRGNLLRGKVTSCGCVRKEASAANVRDSGGDLSGQRFGRLTVLYPDYEGAKGRRRRRKETFIFSRGAKVMAFVLGILYLLIAGFSVLAMKEAGALTAYRAFRFVLLAGCDIASLVCLAIGKKKTEIAALILIVLFVVTQYFTTLLM